MTRLRVELWGVTWSGLQGCPAGRATFTDEALAREYAGQLAVEWPVVTLHRGVTSWESVEQWDVP